MSSMAGYKNNFEFLFVFGQFLMMFGSEIAFGAYISYAMEILGPSGRSWIGVSGKRIGIVIDHTN